MRVGFLDGAVPPNPRQAPVVVKPPSRARAALVLIVAGLVATAAGGCGAAAPPAPDASAPAPESAPAGSSEVSGRLSTRPGAPTAVVTLDPREPLDVPLPAEPAEMDQYGRAFIPRLVVVREGQTVRFINSENDLHNVHVVDEAGETLFNVGMPIIGGTYEHVFEHAGDYRVGCNLHQQMAATVRVTSSPFIAIADRDGGFAVSGVPYGVYDVEVRRGGERLSRVVAIDGPRTDLGDLQ